MAKKKKQDDYNRDAMDKALAPYEQQINAAAKQYSFDPKSIKAHIYQESHGKPSRDGLMQAGTTAVKQLQSLKNPDGSNVYNVKYNPTNPEDSINAGTAYLDYLRGMKAKKMGLPKDDPAVVEAYTKAYNGGGDKQYNQHINRNYKILNENPTVGYPLKTILNVSTIRPSDY
mgnify:CR=1 FL=1